MGKLEKVIVLTVLAVIAVILVISLTLDDPLKKDKLVLAGGAPDRGAAAENAAKSPVHPAGAPTANVAPGAMPSAGPIAAGPNASAPANAKPVDLAAAGDAAVANAAAANVAHPSAPSTLLSTSVAPKQESPSDAHTSDIPAGSLLKSSDGLQESYLPEMRFYTWQSGDSFRSVATKYYGDAAKFTLLRRSNEGRDNVQPGEKILVPVFDLDAPRATDVAMAAPASGAGAANTASKPAPHSKDAAASTPKPAVAPKTADASGAPRVHVVLDGESLWKIAKLELGDGGRWNEIYEANRDVLSKPEAVHAGLKLRVPAK
jgi:nucleoid-associated protein YgaU